MNITFDVVDVDLVAKFLYRRDGPAVLWAASGARQERIDRPLSLCTTLPRSQVGWEGKPND